MLARIKSADHDPEQIVAIRVRGGDGRWRSCPTHGEPDTRGEARGSGGNDRFRNAADELPCLHRGKRFACVSQAIAVEALAIRAVGRCRHTEVEVLEPDSDTTRP